MQQYGVLKPGESIVIYGKGARTEGADDDYTYIYGAGSDCEIVIEPAEFSTVQPDRIEIYQTNANTEGTRTFQVRYYDSANKEITYAQTTAGADYGQFSISREEFTSTQESYTPEMQAAITDSYNDMMDNQNEDIEHNAGDEANGNQTAEIIEQQSSSSLLENNEFILPGSNSSGEPKDGGPIKVNKPPQFGEEIINGLIQGLGWVIDGLMGSIFGIATGTDYQTITVDKFVFNQYEPTKISYFDDNQGDDSIAGTIKDTVTGIYKTFVGIAVVVYLFILIYTGIRIVISATAAEKSRYKEMLKNWMIGLIMLFFFQYVMMFVIQLNDSIISVVKDKFVSNQSTASNLTSSLQEEYQDVGAKCYYQPSEGNTSVVTKGNITYSAIWLVLLGKTIIIAIFYFKRLLTVTVLIVVFPLITITYALDKMNDGKSQVFNAWFSEYMLNVLIQALQALVYTVVLKIAGQIGSSIFAIFAVLSFDAIAEKIIVFFGLKSGAGMYKGIAASALQFSALKQMVTGTAGKFIGGAKGIESGVKEIRNYKREDAIENKMAEKGMDKVSLLKNNKTTQETASGEATGRAITSATAGAAVGAAVGAAGTGAGSGSNNSQEVNYQPSDEEVLATYSASGYDQNDNGEYFNPWTDDYEADYDPRKDKSFIEEARKNYNIREQTAQSQLAQSQPEQSQPEQSQSVQDMNSKTVTLNDEQVAALRNRVPSTSEMIQREAERKKKREEAYEKIAKGALQMGSTVAVAPGAVLFGAGMGETIPVATTALDMAGYAGGVVGENVGNGVSRTLGRAEANKENNAKDADEKIEKMLGIDGVDLADDERQQYIEAVKQSRKTAKVTGNSSKAVQKLVDKAPSHYNLHKKNGDEYGIQEKTFLSSGTRKYSVQLDKLDQDALKSNAFTDKAIKQTVDIPGQEVEQEVNVGAPKVKTKINQATNVNPSIEMNKASYNGKAMKELMNSMNWKNASQVDELKKQLNSALDGNSTTVSKLELTKNNTERVKATIKCENSVAGEFNVEFDRKNLSPELIQKVSNDYRTKRESGTLVRAAQAEVERKFNTQGVKITTARKGSK